jgi:hypothetical protein
VDGLGAGDEPAAQQGIVNVRLNVFPARNASGAYNFSSITAAFDAYNMSSFIGVEDIWHGRSESCAARGNCVAPGWQAALRDIVAAASPHLASGAVAGLFLGDEIVCGGIPASNLSAVAAGAKHALRSAGHPLALVYVNECRGSFIGAPGRGCWDPIKRPCIKGKIPAGLDIISFDSCALRDHASLVASDALVS